MRTFAIKEVRAVFTRKGNGLGKLAHQLHDLRDMVIVFAVPGSRCGVEQIVTTCQQFEDLFFK